MVRIGIDSSNLIAPAKTGIQRYTASLISGISQILTEYPDLELFLYFQGGNRETVKLILDQLHVNMSRINVRYWPVSRGYRFFIPIVTKFDKINLFHYPEPKWIRFYPCSTLTTVHDLCWSRLPDEIVSGERSINLVEAEKSIKSSSFFIAVSQNTKVDIVNEYQVPPERIWVTYEGVDPIFKPNENSPQKILEKYSLCQYILCVSTLQKRKNLIRLIEAYELLISQNAIYQDLVIAGSNGWGHEEIRAMANRFGISQRVHLLNYVPEEDLPDLYAAADLFVYPSLYEGFGLPVIEAMACGTPTIVANNSSLPEIAGDASICFNGLDVNDMSMTIKMVLGNQALMRDLRARGIKRAKSFSWKDTAISTANLYMELACN